MRLCPRCGIEMKMLDYEGVEIETCSKCEGEWLDAGELDVIVQSWEKTFSDKERAQLDAVNKAHFAPTFTPSHPSTDGGNMTCPTCEAHPKLERFNYAGTSNLMLDKCSTCKGIWFDKGELDHVQILVEEWQKTLCEDMGAYGDILKKAEEKQRASIAEGQPRFRSGVLSYFMGFIMGRKK